jgi:tetratricopeptide (TPR) repeat protein
VPATSPDYARAQLELARLCERAKREADARAAYARAVAAAPTDGVARFESGRLLMRSTDDESEAAGTEALRFATYLAPDWSEAHFAFGQALVRVKRLEEAVDAFQRAVALDRTSAPGHFELASLLHHFHRDREALGHAKRVLELAPENAEAGKLLEAIQATVKD